MIWGMSPGSDLARQTSQLENWQHDAKLLRSSEMLVRATVLLFIADRPKGVPHFTGTWDDANPLNAVEHACLEWLRTRKLSTPSHIVPRALNPLTSESKEEVREAVLALAALGCTEPEAFEARRRVLSLRPRGGDPWPQEFLEMLFLTTPNARARFRFDVQVRKGWAFRLCAAAFGLRSVSPLFALGIRYCEEAGLDIKEQLRETIAGIDNDLYNTEAKACISLDDRKLIQYSVIRKPRPGFEIVQHAHGHRGRISAGLPMFLEDVVYMPPPYLIRLLSAQVPMKPIARARSWKDLHDLLTRDDSVVRVRMELSGDISIDPTELKTYEDRLQAGLDWVKGSFPEIRANAEIVLSRS
jgi:hypothetical protein